PLIRQTLESLKGEDRERHESKFANALFTHLNSVKPSVKVRYLKEGFVIVGDHPQAHDARKVYDYYKDLITELKLEAVIDGSDVRVRLAGDAARLSPSPGPRPQGRQACPFAAGPRFHGHIRLCDPADRISHTAGRRRSGKRRNPAFPEAANHADARRAAGQGR